MSSPKASPSLVGVGLFLTQPSFWVPSAGVLGGVEVFRGGEGHQHLLQGPALGFGEGEPPGGGTVAVEGQGEAALLSGEGLGFLEGAAVVVLADLGGDHGQDPGAQGAQLGGVVEGGEVDEVGLGLGEESGVDDEVTGLLQLGEVRREVVEGTGDDDGLVEIERRTGECFADVVVALVQGGAGPGLAVGGGPGPSGGHGPPRGGRGRPGLLRDVDVLGVGGEGEAVGVEVTLQGVQLEQRLPGRGRVEGEHRALREGRDGTGDVTQGLALGGLLVVGGHGTSQAVTADNGPARSRLSTHARATLEQRFDDYDRGPARSAPRSATPSSGPGRSRGLLRPPGPPPHCRGRHGRRRSTMLLTNVLRAIGFVTLFGSPASRS